MDVFVTSGSGKTKELGNFTSVYRRTDEVYQLKMKAARTFYSELTNKFTLMPFTLRAFEDETRAKLGLKECVNHDLLQSYNVQQDADNVAVAQFKFTVLVVANGNIRINGGLFDPSTVKSASAVTDPELIALLAQSANRKTGGKKKKKKAKSAVEEAKKEEVADVPEPSGE